MIHSTRKISLIISNKTIINNKKFIHMTSWTTEQTTVDLHLSRLPLNFPTVSAITSGQDFLTTAKVTIFRIVKRGDLSDENEWKTSFSPFVLNLVFVRLSSEKGERYLNISQRDNIADFYPTWPFESTFFPSMFERKNSQNTFRNTFLKNSGQHWIFDDTDLLPFIKSKWLNDEKLLTDSITYILICAVYFLSTHLLSLTRTAENSHQMDTKCLQMMA